MVQETVWYASTTELLLALLEQFSGLETLVHLFNKDVALDLRAKKGPQPTFHSTQPPQSKEAREY